MLPTLMKHCLNKIQIYTLSKHYLILSELDAHYEKIKGAELAKDQK